MNVDLINAIAKWVVIVVILAGSFAMAYLAVGDVQAWVGLIGIIVGWVVRDSAGSSATANAARLAAPAPGTVNVTLPSQQA